MFGSIYSNGQHVAPIGSEPAPLPYILKELKRQKNAAFLYEPETIQQIYIETPFDYREDVKSILKKILPPVQLKFKKVGRHNFIIKKTKRKRYQLGSRINQKPGNSVQKKSINQELPPRTISGQLSNEAGEALPGGTLFLKGTTIGTVTDEFGRYELLLPAGKQTMMVSFTGFEERSFLIADQSRLNIVLKVAENELDEIVITAVGIAANKRKMGYSIDNLSIDDLNQTNEYNLVQALSQKSSGLWINSSSGSPGASAQILIRGFRSINGNNKPLFILDGMPIDNSTFGTGTGGVDVSNRLIDLNMQDIEKISVLKGASATVLYGIRAANGAIVISSKKGKLGAPGISFSTSLGFNSVNKLPPRQRTYAQGIFDNGKMTYKGPETNENASYGPPLSQLEYDGATDYPYDKKGRLVALGGGNGLPAESYDPYQSFFVNGWIHQQHLSVSGGTNFLNYYMSFGHLRENGIVPKANFERYSFKGVFDLKVSRQFSATLFTNLSHADSYRMKRGSMFSGVPLGLFRNPNSFDIGNGKSGMAAANDPATYQLDNGQQRSFRANGSYDNPFWTVNRNPFDDKVNRVVQNVTLNYQLSDWLSFSYIAGIDYYEDRRKDAFDIYSGTHPKGLLDWTTIRSTNFNSDFLIKANKKINDQWHLKATIGHNYYQSRFKTEETTGDELKQPGIYALSNAFRIFSQENIFNKKLSGIYADLLFSYKNILYLNLSGRNDWSSTLPKRNNSFFYPGVHLGFEFTELLGLTDHPLLSYGKLRLSYAKAGNDAGVYLTDTYYNFGLADGDDLLPAIEFPAFGINAFERSTILGNSQLKPETSSNFEIGTDLKLLKGRLQVDFTWYNSITSDQIVNAQLSASTGFLQSPRNAGTIENKGIEWGMKFVPVRQNNFRWEVKSSFSKFNSIVKSLPEGIPNIVMASFTNLSSVIIEGQPYGVLVGTSVKRHSNGQMIIDSEGFPALDNQQTIVGDPNPDWLLGIQNTFNFNRFSFHFLVDIRKGGDLWNGTRGVMSYLGISEVSGDLRDTRNYVFEGLTESGEPNTKEVDFANPANGMNGIYWRRYGFLGLAENHIEDASWIRLREVNLSYRFTPRWFSNRQSELSLVLSGYNLLLFTKYSGIDPETNLRGDSNIIGWDYFNLPNVKGWNLKIGLNF